jgi:hypothetical protein
VLGNPCRTNTCSITWCLGSHSSSTLNEGLSFSLSDRKELLSLSVDHICPQFFEVHTEYFSEFEKEWNCVNI